MASRLINLLENELTQESPRFTCARSRRDWQELRRCITDLTFGSVWAGRSEEAFEDRVYSTHTLPAAVRPAENAVISFGEYCAVLEQLKSTLAARIAGKVATFARTFVPNGGEIFPYSVEGKRWGATLGHLIEQLTTAPQGVHSVLFHGSLQDGGFVDGYSDVDVHVILDTSQGGRRLSEVVPWLRAMAALMVEVNSCAHHGPMVVWMEELSFLSESVLPSAVVEKGVWLKGGVLEAHYLSDPFETLLSLASFEPLFEEWLVHPTDVRSAFDAVWWSSSLLLLPLLHHQFVTGRSIYKADWFGGCGVPLPSHLAPVLRETSTIRVSLGRWIASRSVMIDPALSDPLYCAVADRARLALDPADVRLLGIDEEHMARARLLWRFVAESVSAFLGCAANAEIDDPEARIPWRKFGQLPQHISIDDYDAVRRSFLNRCAAESRVISVMEFGEVGSPGLSDLDFCVLLDGQGVGVPAGLHAAAFGAAEQYVMDHDPMFCGADNADLLGAIFPLFRLKHLAGEAIKIPFSDVYANGTQAASVSTLCLRKYPGDIDWLLRQPELNIRTILAFLHSSHHIAHCLRVLGLPDDSRVGAAVALDAQIRSTFRAPVCLPDELVRRAVACVTALPLIVRGGMEKYWRSVVTRAFGAQWQRVDPSDLLDWVRCELARTDGGGMLKRVADYREYFALREIWVNGELDHLRLPSPYVLDPDARLRARISRRSPNGFEWPAICRGWARAQLAVSVDAAPGRLSLDDATDLVLYGAVLRPIRVLCVGGVQREIERLWPGASICEIEATLPNDDRAALQCDVVVLQNPECSALPPHLYNRLPASCVVLSLEPGREIRARQLGGWSLASRLASSEPVDLAMSFNRLVGAGSGTEVVQGSASAREIAALKDCVDSLEKRIRDLIAVTSWFGEAKGIPLEADSPMKPFVLTSGWHKVEGAGSEWWCWAGQQEARIVFCPDPERRQVNLWVRSVHQRDMLEIKVGLGAALPVAFAGSEFVSVSLQIEGGPGPVVLRISSPLPVVRPPGDGRDLSFAIRGVSVAT